MYNKITYQNKCREDPNYRKHLTDLARERREKYPEEVKRIRRVSMQKRNAELKLQVYSLLGGRCVHCNYVGPALQVDHINGGGCKEERKGATYYHRLLKVILSGEKRYQLLCANCNWEKRLYNKEAIVLPWV